MNGTQMIQNEEHRGSRYVPLTMQFSKFCGSVIQVYIVSALVICNAYGTFGTMMRFLTENRYLFPGNLHHFWKFSTVPSDPVLAPGWLTWELAGRMGISRRCHLSKPALLCCQGVKKQLGDSCFHGDVWYVSKLWFAFQDKNSWTMR